MVRNLPVVEPPTLLPAHLERPAQAEAVLTDIIVEASRRLRYDPVFRSRVDNNVESPLGAAHRGEHWGGAGPRLNAGAASELGASSGYAAAAHPHLMRNRSRRDSTMPFVVTTTLSVLGATGALLVAPPDCDRAETPDMIGNFGLVPRSPLPFPSILVASRDDPYIFFERAHSMGKYWGSRFVDAGHRGHINAQSGLGDWAFGQSLLDELVGDAHSLALSTDAAPIPPRQRPSATRSIWSSGHP